MYTKSAGLQKARSAESFLFYFLLFFH